MSGRRTCRWCRRSGGPRASARAPSRLWEFFGIAFNHGAFMPALPTAELVDTAVDLPRAGRDGFWLHGRAWQFPSFENADTFVQRLVREGLLVHDAVVGDSHRGARAKLTARSLRRRFFRATGLTPGLIRQIESARQATALLQSGVSIVDTANACAYFDQPHLTRALKRFIGHTPAQILDMNGFADMSLSYKTSEFRRVMDALRR